MRRVVVTGLGAVTPLGGSAPESWENLCRGVSGVGPITAFDATAFRTRIAGQVGHFNLPPDVSQRAARGMDRFARFALAAAVEAWRDSCLSSQYLDPYEVGVLIGSSHGGEHALLAEADRCRRDRASPRLIPRMLGNMAAAHVGMHLDLAGPSFALGSACATGAHSIGEASEIIRRGDATAMVCGAADACITPLTLAGDSASGALSTRNDAPWKASRPFDRDRDGFVLGEGGGILILEERDHAIRRGAPIYAELTGYAATTDAYHETRPQESGLRAARAAERALQKAGLGPDQVDAVFAHATSTRLGDVAEARALEQVFGQDAAYVPVTAIKSSLGHLLGAAGAVQAVAAVQALRHQLLPPTLNLESPDPACRLRVVAGAALPLRLTHVLSNSFGFGGHNACLVFRSHG